MGTSVNPGLRLEDYNNLKYSLSLNNVGQDVFLKAFQWGYKGGDLDIKSALLALPGYNKTKFRKDFNASQREKIEKGDKASMDITLLYKLLQLLCGLNDPNDSNWTMADSDSLEYYLYAVKMKRNEEAHEGLKLSSTQLNDKVEKLRFLFLKIISKATTAFGVNEKETNDLVHCIDTRLNGIKDSPVPLSTVVEHEKEVFTHRKSCIIDEGRREMARLREVLCQTSVVPYLTQHKINVNDLYTEPRLKRDENQITQRQLSVDESYISVQRLFEAKECDGFIPNIIVISGLNGMGRSTMLKYLLEKGLDNCMKGTENLDLFLYLECHKISFSTVDELVSLLLPHTSATFQPEQFTKCFLAIDFAVMFDDIEVLDTKSFAVFEKFMQVLSPKSRVILTASREKAKDVQRKVSSLHKRCLFLELEGINENQTQKHLQKILQTLPSKNHDHKEQELFGLIKEKQPYLQEHLKSPEILGLIAFGWSFAPDRVNTSTTVTEIFLLVEKLFVHKMYLSLLTSSLPSMLDQNAINENLYEFLLTISSIAFETLKKGSFSIEPRNLQRILCRCKDLDLPKSIVSLFLSYTEEENTDPITPTRKVSFPRRSMLYYYAAWFITQEIKEAESSVTIKDLMGVTRFSEESSTNYQSMFKYMVGMLASLMPRQLETRAKEIIRILKELNVTKGSLWLQYIEEAKCEPTITLEILKEMGESWDVEDYSISLTLQHVLEKRTPSSIVITACRSPSDFPHLEKILNTCRAHQKMNVTLHLYQHFWSEKTNFSDKYLSTLLGSSESCQLEHFAGRLSESAISLLPKSLKRLALHITPDMIKSLNEHLLRLPLLQMLYLNLNTPEIIDPASVTPLCIPRTSVVLSVDMWRVSESSVDWACDVAKALSSCYARLVLRHSSLDVSASMKWMIGLRDRDIKVSWIVIGSIHDISKEDEEQLRQYAAATGCEKFVWLKI